MKIYLDHNACTPVDPRVLDRFVAVEREAYGNPASVHQSGRDARRIVEDARGSAAAALGVATDQVLFLSGGTEANNLLVRGLGPDGSRALLAPIEHPSLLHAAEQRGAHFWSVADDGRARVSMPQESAADIGVVCLVHGQSELGTLQPVDAAREVADALGAPLVVDASQSLGRVPLESVIATADAVTLSTHKAGGLRGATAVVVKHPEMLRPLLLGGNQERGLRPGTASPALAAATALTIELALREQPERATAMDAVREAFEASLLTDPRVVKLTPRHALPNTLMLHFPYVDGRALMPGLDLAGVECSQGSACSTGSPTPPRVLECIGLNREDARRCVRFSWSHRTCITDARTAARRVVEVLDQLPPIRRDATDENPSAR